jgi:hypothetical protein
MSSHDAVPVLSTFPSGLEEGNANPSLIQNSQEDHQHLPPPITMLQGFYQTNCIPTLVHHPLLIPPPPSDSSSYDQTWSLGYDQPHQLEYSSQQVQIFSQGATPHDINPLMVPKMAELYEIMITGNFRHSNGSQWQHHIIIIDSIITATAVKLSICLQSLIFRQSGNPRHGTLYIYLVLYIHEIFLQI